jgi:sugar lactone lactonase YvrE
VESRRPTHFSCPVVRALFRFSAIALLSSASGLLAQAPPVVVDAQQTLGSGYSNPRAVAVAVNGTVYVADQNHNQVVQLATNLPAASTSTQVSTGGYGLAGPSALAVDAAGDLFIGDYPNLFGVGVPRIIECLATNEVLNGNCQTVYQGGLSAVLNQPNALAVDRNGTVYVGIIGLATGIYSSAHGSGTLTKLNINGLPGSFTPSALVRDAATDLYFADSSAASGGLYVVPTNQSGSVNAIPIPTASFSCGKPSGLALDASGDLFVLSQLTVNGATADQVMEIPGDSPTTPYLIPSSGLGTTGGVALDPSGNIYVVEQGNGLLTQLDYLNTINLGAAATFGTGIVVPFNFEYNSPATIRGFQIVTVGDTGPHASDVSAVTGGSCATGALSPTVSEYQPYLCSQSFRATPQYTGTRVSAIQVNGSSSVVLASSPVYESGTSGAQVVYPLGVATTATPLQQPQGVAVSGFDQTVYVADFSGGYVYATGGLNGTALTTVDTGNIVLQAPSAVAMNGEGDLYIADFNQGEVVVVPTRTGKAPYVLQTESLLTHPISLALDYVGNLYVGDAGSDGDGATSSNPGYVVKVPQNGTPFRMTIPSVSIIFPQALATDERNAGLYIGDGGDIATAVGQVVRVSADGSTAGIVSFPSQTAPTNPTGLSVDAAGDLYVLDGTVSTITVAPPTGNSYLVGFVNTSLSAPSAFASSAGGQNFVVANIGNGSSNSLVYLQGNSSALAFGNQKVNTNSSVATATLHNIGNATITLSRPFYRLTESGSVFTVASSSACSNGSTVRSAASCTTNLVFRPTAFQIYSGQLSIVSSAYNNGTPVLNLSGTGSATASLSDRVEDSVAAGSERSGQSGRKSFQPNGARKNLGRRQGERPR